MSNSGNYDVVSPVELALKRRRLRRLLLLLAVVVLIAAYRWYRSHH